MQAIYLTEEVIGMSTIVFNGMSIHEMMDALEVANGKHPCAGCGKPVYDRSDAYCFDCMDDDHY